MTDKQDQAMTTDPELEAAYRDMLSIAQTMEEQAVFTKRESGRLKATIDLLGRGFDVKVEDNGFEVAVSKPSPSGQIGYRVRREPDDMLCAAAAIDRALAGSESPSAPEAASAARALNQLAEENKRLQAEIDRLSAELEAARSNPADGPESVLEVSGGPEPVYGGPESPIVVTTSMPTGDGLLRCALSLAAKAVGLYIDERNVLSALRATRALSSLLEAFGDD